jgi:SAM-dependent methyltransferase
MDESYWDELYGARDQWWSGNPNPVLVTEVTGLPPGRALDVGCGEGADAMWLAERGWRVTGADVSSVALERAAAEAGRRGLEITWRHADHAAQPPPAAGFDLVSVHFLPLPRQDDRAALRGLVAAVAPGGTLLVVGHDLTEIPRDWHERAHGHADPRVPELDAFHPVSDFADALPDDWTVLVDEVRPRPGPPPPGTHHTADVVLRARRWADSRVAAR